MRLTILLTTAALALAATTAAAACSDPAGAPAVAGKVFVGVFALGTSAADKPLSFVFASTPTARPPRRWAMAAVLCPRAPPGRGRAMC